MTCRQSSENVLLSANVNSAGNSVEPTSKNVSGVEEIVDDLNVIKPTENHVDLKQAISVIRYILCGYLDV
jgi:hypothetical protein